MVQKKDHSTPEQTDVKSTNNKNIITYIIAFLQGFAMGISNIIPGVSGGTIALVMGIYTRFIKAISDISKWITSLLKKIKATSEKKGIKFREIEWFWIISLMVGRGIAVIVASGLIRYFIDYYPSQTYGLFFGLILASVIVPGSKIKRFRFYEFLAVLIGFILLFWFSGLETFYTNPSPPMWLLLVGGFMATSAMILPGISGSFLLLIIGIHYFVFGIPSKILHGELFTYSVMMPLLFYSVGWILGILSFSRFINYSLKNHHDITMSFLIGLMLGSLRKIYPFLLLSERQPNMKIDEIPKIFFWNMPKGLSLGNYICSMDFISVMISLLVGVAVVITLHKVSLRYSYDSKS